MWDTISRVFITSMNKGQFPAAILGLILIIITLRIPPEDLSRFVFEVKEDIKGGALLGYAVGFFATSGWFIHARWQRRVISNEIHRIGQEKSRIQTDVLEVDVKSSEQ